MEGANDATPNLTHKDFSAWEQSGSRVLYYSASNVDDQLLSYIRDAKTPNEALGNLKKIFVASTTAKKLQLRQELSNVRQRDMSVADYTSRIKDICDSLASINVNVEEEEMVQVCLGGLAHKFGSFLTAVCRKEKSLSFVDLQSTLLVEENHTGASTSTHADNKLLYTEEDRTRGRGGRGGSARNGGS